MNRDLASTVETAVQVLNCAGLEVITIQSGWILRSMDAEGAYQELLCESKEDLLACARWEQQRQPAERPLGLGQLPADWFTAYSRSSMGRRCQATLTGWWRPRMNNNHKEVGP